MNLENVLSLAAHGHPWLLQAKSGKVQSFSKFQAELRAQHKQSKGSRHKPKRDKQHHSDKPDMPKAKVSAAGNHADSIQVSWMADCVSFCDFFLKCCRNF